MKKSWPVNVLKVEERHVQIMDSYDHATKTAHWRTESNGWWAVLETHPHISIRLGDSPLGLEPNQTLILTLESQP